MKLEEGVTVISIDRFKELESKEADLKALEEKVSSYNQRCFHDISGFSLESIRISSNGAFDYLLRGRKEVIDYVESLRDDILSDEIKEHNMIVLGLKDEMNLLKGKLTWYFFGGLIGGVLLMCAYNYFA